MWLLCPYNLFIVIDFHHLHYRSIVPLGTMYTFYLLRFVMPSALQSWGRITCVGICAVIMQGSVHDDSTELHVMYPSPSSLYSFTRYPHGCDTLGSFTG